MTKPNSPQNTLLQVQGVSRSFGGEKQIRQPVCNEPVDFFGHGAVIGAEAGFDVGYRDQQLGGDQRRRQRGILQAPGALPHGCFGPLRLGGLEPLRDEVTPPSCRWVSGPASRMNRRESRESRTS